MVRKRLLSHIRQVMNDFNLFYFQQHWQWKKRMTNTHIVGKAVVCMLYEGDLTILNALVSLLILLDSRPIALLLFCWKWLLSCTSHERTWNRVIFFVPVVLSGCSPLLTSAVDVVCTYWLLQLLALCSMPPQCIPSSTWYVGSGTRSWHVFLSVPDSWLECSDRVLSGISVGWTFVPTLGAGCLKKLFVSFYSCSWSTCQNSDTLHFLPLLHLPLLYLMSTKTEK